ncbi:MAG: radical SAM protein [Bacillota bacterium]|nr:radical SAM protein [Bacillota bacterium]
MINRSTDLAKRYLGEKLLNQAIGYLEKDPEGNFIKTLDLAMKAPILSWHQDYIVNIKSNFKQNPAIQQYIRRIFNEIDENVRNHLLVNFFLNASLIGVPIQKRKSDEFGFNIPFTILIDPTSNCNLSCKGCWAGAYKKHDSLSLNEMNRLVSEAKELGIYFIVLSGGEPFMWPHLEELCRNHPDVAFMVYTNGTLIDENAAGWMRSAGNISPAISIEGWRETTDDRRGTGVFDKIIRGMGNLKAKGVPFGFSVTATRDNCEEISSEEFIDFLIEKGAFYGWTFHYIPIGRNPDFSMRITPGQRAEMVYRIREIRKTKPIQVVDFWNDGHLTGGCIAGGRRYFHITANGNVEPCAFVHFAVDTIYGKSLQDILANPLFAAYQSRQPFSNNLLRPCPLIDVPDQLREIVTESGARPTHEGADDILYGETARKMDKTAQAWKEEADRILNRVEGKLTREESQV